MPQNTPIYGRIKIDDPITMMFSDRVKRDKVDEYETWLRDIHSDAKKFDGLLDVNFVKPSDPYSPEYITIIKFDNQENINNWMRSVTHAKWLAKLPDLINHSADMQQASG